MNEREQHLNYIAFFGCNSIYEVIIIAATVVVFEAKLMVKIMAVE